MVRTKAFDEDLVIDAAMRAFLKYGYSSTSLSILESATGVGRKSLYNTFGNKRGLLLKALDRFNTLSAAEFVAPLEVPAAGRAAIEHVVRAMVTRMTSKAGRDGCLLCLSAQDPIGASKPVAPVIAGYFSRARAGFLRCIEAGVKRGEISAATPPAVLADYFVGVIMGISTLARVGASKAAISDFADTALGALD